MTIFLRLSKWIIYLAIYSASRTERHIVSQVVRQQRHVHISLMRLANVLLKTLVEMMLSPARPRCHLKCRLRIVRSPEISNSQGSASPACFKISQAIGSPLCWMRRIRLLVGQAMPPWYPEQARLVLDRRQWWGLAMELLMASIQAPLALSTQFCWGPREFLMDLRLL